MITEYHYNLDKGYWEIVIFPTIFFGFNKPKRFRKYFIIGIYWLWFGITFKWRVRL